MSQPIVFISHNRVKQDKLEELKQVYPEAAEYIREHKPGTLAHLGFLNADGTELTIVHVFRDAEAMESHMEAAAEMAKKGAQVMDSQRLEVYGNPLPQTLEQMQQIASRLAASGVTLTVHPQPVGGYLRLQPD